MNILWLKTELLHPLDRGGKIRTYAMLRELCKDHRITYLCLDDTDASEALRQQAKEYCASLITVPFRTAKRESPEFFQELFVNLFSQLPYAVAKYRSDEFGRRIRAEVESDRYDVLVCDFLFPAIELDPDLSIPLVLFQHNIEAGIWERHMQVAGSRVRRAYMKQQWRRMRQYEKATTRKFDHVVAVSESDAEFHRREYGVASVSHVQTGVDIDYFSPVAQQREEASLVFVGAMDWLPNEDAMIWFATEILPTIRLRVPHATLKIVGRNPGRAVRKLEDLDGVIVTGAVPDVRPYLAKAAAVVMPLRIGGGTRIKLYEALSMNAPVISTTVGAEGLDVEPGRHLFIADTAESIADSCVSVLRNREMALAVGSVGGEHVRARFSWATVTRDFASDLQQVVNSGVRRTNLGVSR